MSEHLTAYTGSALSAGNFEHTMHTAEKLAKSTLLPEHFRNKPENVLIVLALAQDLNINPIMALQQVSVISGKPCLQATLMISLLAQRGCLKGPLQFKREGDVGQPSHRCTAWGIDAATGEKIEGPTISLAMAQAEGWTRNPKYRTLPELMLQWRAASFFIRAYYPHVVMGMHTAEEMEDIQGQPQGFTSGKDEAREKLRVIREAKNLGNGSPETAETTEAEVLPRIEETLSDVLLDFITGVNDATDGAELTRLADQGRDFEADTEKEVARKAIATRAEALGLKWSGKANAYITITKE